MRINRAFTGRHNPGVHHSKLSAYELLVRGGYMSEVDSGLYAWQPAGFQVLRNIWLLLQKELRALGGQEILLPILNPAESWKLSGRDRLDEDEIIKVPDPAGGSFILAHSHEIGAMEMFRASIQSATQLPAFVYQFQSKIRNVAGKPHGLERTREFVMCDAFSLHTSFADLNNFIPRIHKAFKRVFNILGLPIIIAGGSANQMAGERSFDFFLLNEQGDYGIASCEQCNYFANQDVASGTQATPGGTPLPVQTIIRLGLENMDSLARTLGVPHTRMVKSRLYWGIKSPFLVVMRGDQFPSIDKLSKVAGETILREANHSEIRRLGLDPGLLSPIGLDSHRLEKKGLKIIVDRVAAESPNLLMPVNEANTYQINANFGRDFDADIVGDISRIGEGHHCLQCGGPISIRRAWKLGSIFHLGDHYSKCFNFTIQSDQGHSIHPHLGAYGINPARLILAMVETRRTSRGFVLPLELISHKAVLLQSGWSHRISSQCESIHDKLSDLLLWDDREVPLQNKLSTADRMGIALRIIVNRQSLEDGKVAILDAGIESGLAHQRLLIKDVRGFILERSKQELNYTRQRN